MTTIDDWTQDTTLPEPESAGRDKKPRVGREAVKRARHEMAVYAAGAAKVNFKDLKPQGNTGKLVDEYGALAGVSIGLADIATFTGSLPGLVAVVAWGTTAGFVVYVGSKFRKEGRKALPEPEKSRRHTELSEGGISDETVLIDASEVIAETASNRNTETVELNTVADEGGAVIADGRLTTPDAVAGADIPVLAVPPRKSLMLGDTSRIEEPERLREEGNYLRTVFHNAGIAGAEDLLIVGYAEHDDGSWTAELALPDQITPAVFKKYLEKIAGVMDTDTHYLMPSKGYSQKRISIRKFRDLPFTGEPVMNPVAKAAESYDVATKHHPFGTTIDNEVLTLDFTNGLHALFVAASRNGKTEQILSLLATLIFDLEVEIGLVFDGKPVGKYDPFAEAGLIESYVDKHQDGWLGRLASKLEREVEILNERQRRLRSGEKLGHRFVIMDEFQVGFGSAAGGATAKDSAFTKVRNAVEEISRLGGEVNHHLVLASQSYDGNILPFGILNNFKIRVVGWVRSKMSKEALGEFADSYGLDTEGMFVNGKQPGAAVVISPSVNDYGVARGFYQSKEQLQRIIDKAVAMRREHGVATAVKVSEGVQLAQVIVDVFGDVDSRIEYATTHQVAEAVADHLGWEDSSESRARTAAIIEGWGVAKKRPVLPDIGQVSAWPLAKLLIKAKEELRG